MKVKKNTLVKLHYTMRLSNGDEIASTRDAEALEFVCGRGEVVPGLEREIMGLEPGAKKNFTVQPEDAYGRRDESLVKELPRAGFPADLKLQKGQRFSYRSEQGAELMYKVCEIGDQTITADFNHPLAGEVLHYDVEVLSVEEDNLDFRG